jgi:hypothetical protein
MTQVTVNGNTYSDDGTTSHDMQAGGFRVNLLKMISDLMINMLANLNTASNSVTSAAQQVSQAQQQVTLATAQANAAAASAASAAAAPGTNATTTTPVVIALGPLTIAIQVNKAFVVGSFVTVASTATPAKYVGAQITAYNAATGALTLNAVVMGGSGTFNDGLVALSPPIPANIMWATKNSAYTALAGDRIKADTLTNGAFNITFPPNPNDGDPVEIMDVKSNFSQANCSLLGNGKTVMGYTTLNLNVRNFHQVFTYDASLGDWRI